MNRIAKIGPTPAEAQARSNVVAFPAKTTLRPDGKPRSPEVQAKIDRLKAKYGPDGFDPDAKLTPQEHADRIERYQRKIGFDIDVWRAELVAERQRILEELGPEPEPKPYTPEELARIVAEVEAATGKKIMRVTATTDVLRRDDNTDETLRYVFDLQDHPAASLFPLMTLIELESLAADILKRGQQELIRTLDDMILIGRNRYRACQIANVKPRIDAYAEGFNGDPVGEVISSNRHRKHLTGAQLAWIGFQYTRLNYGEALTQAEAATRMSINIDQIRSAAEIDRAALPQIRAAIENGKIKSIGHAHVIVTPTKDEKREGLTSEQKQMNWLNDPANIGGKRSRRPQRVLSITKVALKALTSDQRFVVAKMIFEDLTAQQRRDLFRDVSPQEKLDLILTYAPDAERALEAGMRIFVGETL